jgi:hypothetical protein
MERRSPTRFMGQNERNLRSETESTMVRSAGESGDSTARFGHDARKEHRSPSPYFERNMAEAQAVSVRRVASKKARMWLANIASGGKSYTVALIGSACGAGQLEVGYPIEIIGGTMGPAMRREAEGFELVRRVALASIIEPRNTGNNEHA